MNDPLSFILLIFGSIVAWWAMAWTIGVADESLRKNDLDLRTHWKRYLKVQTALVAHDVYIYLWCATFTGSVLPFLTLLVMPTNNMLLTMVPVSAMASLCMLRYPIAWAETVITEEKDFLPLLFQMRRAVVMTLLQVCHLVLIVLALMHYCLHAIVYSYSSMTPEQYFEKHRYGTKLILTAIFAPGVKLILSLI